ncbi:MAG: hypothetical protein BGP09_34770 [Rhizobium sp. 60-20]|jgi:ribosomal protein S18 acetylase RimI-like enzyme|nr:GNAT family N-acetyltransferase [Rhizobium tropici]OJY74976.1 MAG: hypothetical protein BGP09_34770 [Rhizobium sp. 60-20]
MDAKAGRFFAMLRRATIEDAAQLGSVHVAAWNETYAGLLPEAMLAGQSAEARSAMWARILGDPSAAAGTAVYVIEDQASIVGFGSCGHQRDPRLRELGFAAEISAIYLLRSQQGKGFGRALMGAMTAEIRSRGHDAVALWVLKENAAARDFYRHMGGEVVAEKEDRRDMATLIEVAYGWRLIA